MSEKNLKRIIYFLIAVFSLAGIAAATARAQDLTKTTSATENVLPVAQMLSDFDTLRRVVRESHPNPYRGITEAEAEKNWSAAREKIKKPLTQTQFLNLLYPIYSQYNDGHTFLDLPLESETYKNYGANGGLFFPFKLWEANEKLFVAENLSSIKIPRGTEIIDIDGIDAGKIYRDLTGAMSGDSAANKSATAIRLFSVLYWQRFAQDGRNNGGDFRLKVRRPNTSKSETVSVRGISAEQLEKSMFGDKAVNAYELTPEIFVLEVNKMQASETVKKFIDDAFARVKEKNYPLLVIDIRRNGGGNSTVGDWVFQYLTRKPYRQSSVKEIRLSPLLAENNKFFREWTERLKKNNRVEGDRIVQRSSDIDDTPAPADETKWIYGGKTFLLTSPRTYSSGFMMAETFKCYGFGQMIGDAPGSHRNLTGELMQFRLPNSKIVGYVATSQYYPPCYQKTKTDFLAPDVRVEQTLEDLIAGRDTVLEYVKKHGAKN